MGIQVRCPLCGLTRPPQKFGQYDLAAKEVNSLGGDRGFDHTEIEMPPDLRREIQLAIARLYHRHVPDAEVANYQVGDVKAADVEAEIGQAVEEAVAEEVDDAEVAEEIRRGVELAVMEAEIAQAVEDGVSE